MKQPECGNQRRQVETHVDGYNSLPNREAANELPEVISTPLLAPNTF